MRSKGLAQVYNYNYVTIREEVIPIMITLAVTVDDSTITTNINTSKRAPRTFYLATVRFPALAVVGRST